MDDFTFNTESHEGYYRGQRVPSVTEAIAPLGFDYTRINSEVLDRAISYGNHVHETIMLGLAGTLDLDTLDEPLKDVWYEFAGWFAKTFNVPGLPDERIVTKHRYYSKRLRYHGEPDIVLPDTIIELKTRPFDEHIDCLQTAGYSGLPERVERQEIVVQLLPGYPLKVYHIKRKQRWEMFRKLLDNWHENNTTNDIIKRWKSQ
jgi:hypothetical protein